MQLYIKSNTFEKNYLTNTTHYHYDNLLDLVFELFSKHQFVDRAAELHLLQILKESGYHSIEEIPLAQLNGIVNYFLEHRDTYKVDYDEERLTYLLLAAIQDQNITAIIDKALIKDLQAPIQLSKDSTITFFKMDKLKAIKFKSI